MRTGDRGAEPDLHEYGRILRRRMWIVVLFPAIVASVAYGYTRSQTPLYGASAEILIAQSRAETFFDPSTGIYDPERALANQIRVIQSRDVGKLVEEKLGYPAGVTATFSESEDVITISSSHPDPETAAEMVNAYVDAYLEYRRTSGLEENAVAQNEIRRQIAELQTQIDSLSVAPRTARPEESAERESRLRTALDQQASLQSQLIQLQASANVGRGGAQLLEPAEVPTAPYYPQPKRNLLLGLVVGLLVGTAIAFLLDFIDDRIRGRDDIERVASRLPILGLIPALPGWRNRSAVHVASIEDPGGLSAEAYRTLRTSIQFLGLDQPLRVLQVTSPGAAEGKTTTITNLAVALARAGQRVVIVDCDLRRPRLHTFFGLRGDAGFTSVILGDQPLSEAIQSVPGVPGLRVLPAGPIPPNPSELLSSNRTVELLGAIQADADIVLVDSPPVLPVSDAVVLSTRVDGTLVVVKTNDSHRKQLARAIELLDQVDARVIGTVLNGVARGSESYGAYYGYEYTAQPSGANSDSGQTAKPPLEATPSAR